jgi:hypothetical protein
LLYATFPKDPLAVFKSRFCPAINGKEDLGERLKSEKKRNVINLRFKMYEKEPFNIHLKVRRPDTPLVQGRTEKKWGPFDIFNVMVKAKISFQSIRKYARFI